MKKLLYLICLAFLVVSCTNEKTQMKSKETLEVKSLPSKGEMTILAWYSLPNEEMTPERFRELRDCGFNYSFSHHYTDNDMMENALNLAQEVGVKLIIRTPELSDKPEETVKRFMNHPATGGYFLMDEPHADQFDMLAKWARRIESVDTAHPCYLNLYPIYVDPNALKVGSYVEYVDRFDKEVNLPILSFDNYPVIFKDKEKGTVMVRDNFHQNLEVFLKKSQEVNKPFWAFSLAVAHWTYPIPVMAHMRFQMYSNLAYGAQGLQYFTYWTPDAVSFDFHHAPINIDGKRTEVYDYVKTLNQEIQGLSPVFLGAKVLSVRHTGDVIPSGTTKLETLPSPVKSLTSKGSEGTIVSHLENGDREFLVVVNRDIHNKMMLNIDLDSKVERVMKDGTLVPASAYSSTIGVDPGDIIVYSWMK